MTLAMGSRLGPYEVLAPIGAGGMGEVYKAKDTRLDRFVAIKVLPEAVAQSPDALARFEREAKAVAALSHPNILALHDFGREGATTFAVHELLEGETLRAALEEGALPPRRAIEHALAIARGLAAAHEKGIVHRDLKPDNVFVTRDGRVKILDFGLAKSTAPVAPGETHAPTATGHTDPGTVMGTAGYMSPEQVKGQAVDHRSDLFSFGAVLYEMLTGKGPFRRETTAETMAAILREEPAEPSLTSTAVSPALDRIVRHCLEKKPEQRFQSASDLGFALESAVSSPSAPHAAIPSSRRGPWLGIVAIAACAAVFLLALTLRKREVPSPSLTGVSRLTHDSGISEWPTWSPDGAFIAFTSNRSGNFEIYVRRVDGGQEIDVTNDAAEDFQPAFSPDGRSIAFASTRASRTGIIRTGAAFGLQFRTTGGDLWVAPALGGQARRLAPDANMPTWDASGRHIAYVSGPESHRSILEIPAEGGAPRTILAEADSPFEIMRLHYSPGGAWISCETAPNGELFLIPTKGGAPRTLLASAASPSWDAKDGRIFYLHQEPSGGTRLEAVAVDEASGKVSGNPEAIALMTGILRDTAVLAGGRQIAIAELEGSLNLTRLPMKPDGSGPSGPEEPLSTGHVIDRSPSISPDGRRIAFGSDRLGSEDLWIHDRETGRSERIELPGKDLGANEPHWSPDGRRIVVTRLLDRNGKGALWIVSPDGSQAEELAPLDDVNANKGSFSPDGREVLMAERTNGWSQVFAVETATRKKRQITTTPTDKYDGAFSPDGKWIACESNVGGKFRVVRFPAGGGPEQELVSSDERLRHSFFSRDGRFVYVQPSHRNIWRVPFEGGPMQQVTRFPESGLFLEEPTLAPDGSYLAYCRSNGGSSLWLLTLGSEKEKAK